MLDFVVVYYGEEGHQALGQVIGIFRPRTGCTDQPKFIIRFHYGLDHVYVWDKLAPNEILLSWRDPVIVPATAIAYSASVSIGQGMVTKSSSCVISDPESLLPQVDFVLRGTADGATKVDVHCWRDERRLIEHVPILVRGQNGGVLCNMLNVYHVWTAASRDLPPPAGRIECTWVICWKLFQEQSK